MERDEAITGAAADAIETLVVDHREVAQLFKMLEEAVATDNPRVADDVAGRIVRALSIHAAIEEEALYPVMLNVLGPGEDAERIVRQNVDEHQAIKRLLAEVDGKPGSDPKVFSTFEDIRAKVEVHVHDEETDEFPRLRDELTEEDLMYLGRALDAARKLAPTHPHPNAPATPPFNIVANAAAALLDRARDAVAHRTD
jgi:hemerythrin-like domain-containing protein